jgi:hypothetical protein
MKQEFDVTKLFTRGKSQLQLAITTLVVILLAVSSIFTLVYTYLKTSDAALQSATQMMKATNANTRRDILRYMGTAKRTVTAAAWDFRGLDSVRGHYNEIFSALAGQIRAQREIFAVSVGDSTGSLLMVGKIFDEPKYSVNKAKPLPKEVIYRSHYVDKPGGIEYYLYMNKKMEVVDRENVPAGKITYDARTKAWFKDAEKAKGNAWADVRIYQNGEFGTANIEAIRDAQGKTKLVVMASIALSLNDGISSRLTVGKNGIAFMLDGSGDVIAYPDMDRIIRCEEKPKEEPPKEKTGAPAAPKEAAPRCKFNKVNEINNVALATAFEKYRAKANLGDAGNIPKELEYRDYHKAIRRLDEKGRTAFDKVYTFNEPEQKILLKTPLPKEVMPTVDDVLESINYVYYLRFSAAGEDYLASFQDFPTSYGKEWMIGVLIPTNDFIGALKSTIFQVSLISLFLFLFYRSRRSSMPRTVFSRL